MVTIKFENYDGYSESPCFDCKYRTEEPETFLDNDSVWANCPRNTCPY